MWDWQFLPPPQPPQIFTARGFEALFPCAGTLGCVVCLAPQLFLLVYLHTNVGPPSPAAATLPWSSLPGCMSQSLLPVLMDVFSLTPWLSEFHSVWFSGSFASFLFLNWLLYFFWLCEEAKHIYLCLHPGQKS